MFYLDRMVIQITQEIKRLFIGMDANNLMSGALTRCGNDLNAVAKLMIPLNQIEQPMAL